MLQETELTNETPQQLRARAGRYRQYACYYYHDPMQKGLDELANQLEAKAALIERPGLRADRTA
jgi:hypothetical protein